MTEGPATPRRVATAERRAKALRMRTAGATLEEIAAACGHKTRGAASQDISRALAILRTEPAEEMKALANQRLDVLWRSAMTVLGRTHYVVSNGRLMQLNGLPMRDDDPTLRAIGSLLQIEQRRAKLNGLDAPKQVEVITIDAVEAEIRRLNAELGRVEAGEAAGVEAATS